MLGSRDAHVICGCIGVCGPERRRDLDRRATFRTCLSAAGKHFRRIRHIRNVWVSDSLPMGSPFQCHALARSDDLLAFTACWIVVPTPIEFPFTWTLPPPTSVPHVSCGLHCDARVCAHPVLNGRLANPGCCNEACASKSASQCRTRTFASPSLFSQHN